MYNLQCDCCLRSTDDCKYVNCRGSSRCFTVICKKCNDKYKIPIMMTRCFVCKKISCYQYHFCNYYSKCLFCNNFISGNKCKDCCDEIIDIQCKNKLLDIIKIPNDILNIILAFLKN